VGYALLGPFLEGGHEAVLHHLFGQVEVADEADEGGGQAAGFLSKDG
jgi:hypothetical protein